MKKNAETIPSKNRLIKGMSVVLISGPRDLRGKVYQIENTRDEKVLLTGYPMAKRTKKVTPESQEHFTLRPIYIHKSNVMAYDSDAKKRSRVTFKTNDAGKKIRVLKATQKEII